MISALLGATLVGQKLTFSELEKTKYEFLTKTAGFSGRYDISTLPTGTRQSVFLWMTPSAKRIKVVAGGLDVVESAWTKDRKWLVNHATKQYKDDLKSAGFSIFDEFRPLPVQAGRATFAVAEMGPRFACDPEPAIVADEIVTEEGMKLRRVEAVAKNAETSSEVRIVQLFREGGYITQRFSMEIKSKGNQVLKVNGFLEEAKLGAAVSVSLDLPKAVIGEYQKVSSDGG